MDMRVSKEMHINLILNGTGETQTYNDIYSS
jgi:hypothetical protein